MRRRAATMSVNVVPSASRTSTLAGVVRSFVARSMICPNEERRHGGAKGSGSNRFPSTVTVTVPSSRTSSTTSGMDTGTGSGSGFLIASR